ncbi:MAG: O-antigen ligase family protein [Propionibacteriaceae bacterium]|nr:O-antigen ligase family protein [Propionibacteriaceae bacterium]
MSSATRTEWWLRGFIVACWGYSFIPAAASLVTVGPGVAAGTETLRYIVQTGLYWALSDLFLLTAAICGVMLIARGCRNRTIVVGIEPFLPLLFVGGVIAVSLIRGGIIGQPVFLALLVAFVCLFCRLSDAVWNTCGWLTVATAVLSLVLGLQGSGMASLWEYGNEKTLIGSSALAGPFQHPNSLGVILAVGLPCVVTIERPRLRAAGLAISAFALVWSGSRTSMFACLVGLVVAALCLTPQFRRWLPAIIMGLLAGTASLPFLGLNDSAFTGRGYIWRVTLEAMSGQWIHGPFGNWMLGVGEYVFLQQGIISRLINFIPVTGHSFLFTIMVQYGLVVAAVVVAMVFVWSQRLAPGTFRTTAATVTTAWFILTFVLVGSVESIPLEQVGTLGWLIPLCFLLTTTPAGPTSSAQHRPTATQAPVLVEAPEPVVKKPFLVPLDLFRGATADYDHTVLVSSHRVSRSETRIIVPPLPEGETYDEHSAHPWTPVAEETRRRGLPSHTGESHDNAFARSVGMHAGLNYLSVIEREPLVFEIADWGLGRDFDDTFPLTAEELDRMEGGRALPA